MERFVKGDVVVVPFPFSDLSGSKRRPALVLTDIRGDDIIICQITSKPKEDIFAQALRTEDFVSGSLPVDSFILPLRIFTADKHIVFRKIGKITSERMNKVIDAIIYTLKQ
ncbi:MAG: type II toxin-antitoxin system PemK/MazF family toxin [Prevotellaceae bacterium]|jgi:mRNA interferase MazF|nr:type II toxin-antitoxin system PemK/MazF family toxin [Prevotellaceae bacterium]